MLVYLWKHLFTLKMLELVEHRYELFFFFQSLYSHLLCYFPPLCLWWSLRQLQLANLIFSFRWNSEVPNFSIFQVRLTLNFHSWTGEKEVCSVLPLLALCSFALPVLLQPQRCFWILWVWESENGSWKEWIGFVLPSLLNTFCEADAKDSDVSEGCNME